MKRKVLFVLLAICNSYLYAQTNVGIGTATPTEKLDVNGNINVNGTIKANGVAGQNNQVLMTNSNGNLAWGDISQYKNFIGFSNPGNENWIVPAGVTKLLVEAWGGGGNGAAGGGGGGGGYIQAIFLVTPGENLSIHVGLGSATTNPGESSTVTGLIGTAYAYGGQGASFASSGLGGGFGATGPFYFGFSGENGHIATEKYEQSGSDTFVKTTYYGNGGNGANNNYSGGLGDSRAINASTLTLLKFYLGKPGNIPGGGGGGDNSTGYGGGSGMVIIRY